MKSITLSFAGFIMFIICFIISNRLKLIKSNNSIYYPFSFSIIFLFLYLFLYYLTPPDLYFFDERYLINNILVDLFNGIVLFILLSIGFTDFLIAAVIQPFSTDILLHIYITGLKGLTFEALIDKYIGNKGVDLALSKRLDYLLKRNYVKEMQNQIIITNKGVLVAKSAELLYKVS